MAGVTLNGFNIATAEFKFVGRAGVPETMKYYLGEIVAASYTHLDVIGRHKSMSKVGASSLRRTLFLIMSAYLQNSPPNEPVYQFMDRKRSEGKPYRVYMMASANKFLRIYYATVKAYLETLEQF